MQQTVGSTVRKLNGKWQAIIRIKVQGKWKQVDTKYGFKTKAEANNWISKNIGKYTQTYQINGYEDITLRELKKIFINYKKDKVRYNTMVSITSALKKTTIYDDRKIKTFTKMDLENIINEINKPYVIRRYKEMFNFAINILEMDIKNPTKHLKQQNKPKEKVIANREQFENIIKPMFANKPKYLLYVEIGYNTGLRPNEISGLTYNDIFTDYLVVNKQWDYKHKTFAATKTKNSNRKVPISNSLYKKITEYRQSQSIVTMDNRIFTNNNIRALISDYLHEHLKNTELQGFTPHSLRHSYATNLITNGIDFKTVAGILGDTVETVMRTYSHYTEQGYKQVEQLINRL